MKRSPFLDSPRWLNGAIAIIQNQNLKNRESSVTWTSPLLTFVLFEPNLEWKQNSFAGPLSETFEKRAPGPHYYCYRMHVSPSLGRLGTDRGEICRGSGTKYHHQCQTPLQTSRCSRPTDEESASRNASNEGLLLRYSHHHSFIQKRYLSFDRQFCSLLILKGIQSL